MIAPLLSLWLMHCCKKRAKMKVRAKTPEHHIPVGHMPSIVIEPPDADSPVGSGLTPYRAITVQQAAAYEPSQWQDEATPIQDMQMQIHVPQTSNEPNSALSRA